MLLDCVSTILTYRGYVDLFMCSSAFGGVTVFFELFVSDLKTRPVTLLHSSASSAVSKESNMEDLGMLGSNISMYWKRIRWSYNKIYLLIMFLTLLLNTDFIKGLL